MRGPRLAGILSCLLLTGCTVTYQVEVINHATLPIDVRIDEGYLGGHWMIQDVPVDGKRLITHTTDSLTPAVNVTAESGAALGEELVVKLGEANATVIDGQLLKLIVEEDGSLTSAVTTPPPSDNRVGKKARK